MKLICATRSSALALWQTRNVQATLAETGIQTEELHISTKGDLILDRSLNAIGSDNLFIKELEAALRERRADFAVHSCKDLASKLPDDMRLAAITLRADPRDAYCSERFPALEDLPGGALVGTSSPRRRLQLEAQRPDLRFETIRGNIDTRLRKLREGSYDAIVLAMAGLTRLGIGSRHVVPIPTALMVPAAGQGALAIECRAADTGLAERLAAALGDPGTTLAVTAERAFLRTLGAGCQAPIGAHAVLDGAGTLTLECVLEGPGGEAVRATRSAPVRALAEAEALGAALGRDVEPLAASIAGPSTN